MFGIICCFFIYLKYIYMYIYDIIDDMKRLVRILVEFRRKFTKIKIYIYFYKKDLTKRKF